MQIIQALDGFGVKHGPITIGKVFEATEAVQVACMQILHRYMNGITWTFGLVIIDEAHYAKAKAYRELWDR